MREKNTKPYILGTDDQELYRLGLQHQLWADEAHTGWREAGFTAGQSILDLGCGPGFCTKELAFLAGPSGRVIGVDKSELYIDHLNKTSKLHKLNINGICSDFNSMDLGSGSLDSMYCRWALAWIDNPKEILTKVLKLMKKGGKFVIHEYYDWSTHQIEPGLPGINKGIKAALKSFNESEGNINIGRRLPAILDEIGMTNIKIRPMSKLATPLDDFWHWPKSFYHSYFPRLVDMGLLSNEDLTQAFADLEQLEKTPGVSLCCPLMVEVIAEKI